MSTPYPPPRSSEMVVINLQGRNLSLPKTVVKRGVDGWNSQARCFFFGVWESLVHLSNVINIDVSRCGKRCICIIYT